jgi:hypothetical protein
MLNSLVDLSSIFTPIDECNSVKVGIIDKIEVREIRRKKYDQAPIVGSKGRVVGLMSLAEIEWLRRKGQPLTDETQEIDHQSMPSESTISDLLDVFSQETAVLISSHGEITGLLTLSDLNRPLLKPKLYPSFFQLETLLSDLISETYPEPRAWINHLPDRDQIRLLGYWELSRKKNVELKTGPLHACELSDLITIVTKDKQLQTALGYESNSNVKKELGSLTELRNAVMHPVRPIFLNRTDPPRLKRDLQDLGTALNRLVKAMA